MEGNELIVELEWWAYAAPLRPDAMQRRLCFDLAGKLAICAETIAALAERCHGQSELLAKRAEANR